MADPALSYGATEAKVPDIADAVVEITETGRALRAAGLGSSRRSWCRTPSSSPTRPRRPIPAKRHAMEQILTLLQGTLEARGKVLVKLNVAGREPRFGRRPSCRPCGPPPCRSSRAAAASRVETVVPKADINILIPALKDQGATDILELAAVQDRALRWPTMTRTPVRRGPESAWSPPSTPSAGWAGCVDDGGAVFPSTARRSPTGRRTIEVGTRVVFLVGPGARRALRGPAGWCRV